MDYSVEIFDSMSDGPELQRFRSFEAHRDTARLKRREWWCFQNPQPGAFLAVTESDEMVSTSYLGGKLLDTNAGAIAAYEIGESSTLETHRKKGLFVKIGQACIDYAFSHGADFVYGTPNLQATPGWKRLGFDIISDEKSWLFLAINIDYWINPISYVTALFKSKKKSTELSFDEYSEKTKTFRRLNKTTKDYMIWRFSESPVGYRYFSYSNSSGQFLCSFKMGKISKYPVLICSEYFLNGEKNSFAALPALLSRITDRFYDRRAYAGIYFHSNQQQTMSRILNYLRGVVPHRPLTVCVKAKPGCHKKIDWFEHFQLSDCDNG